MYGMARAKTQTLMPLDRWAELIGFNPLHFNQVVLSDRNVDNGFSCGQTIAQYGWQAHGRVGREEIAQAIDRAEKDIARELGYDVAPRWHEAESIQLPHAERWRLHPYAHIGLRARLLHGYVLSGGREALVELPAGAGVTVSYSSLFGGSGAYEETATIVVSTTITDPQEIALFYPGLGPDTAWEIRPITVVIDTDAQEATITCRREQLVKPEFLEDISAWDEVDGIEDADTGFLTTVDVWRRYNDPATQVRFIATPSGLAFNAFGLLTCGCTGSGCPTCGYIVQSGCMTVRNRREGGVQLSPADWDADLGDYTASDTLMVPAPDKCLVWYRAGYYDANTESPFKNMTRELEQAVVALSLSYLSRPVCGCDGIKDLHEYYATDFAEISGDAGGSLSYVTGYVDNPFGTKRGCIEAWKKIRSMAIGRGVDVYAGRASTY
jgi:hypothetical protein